MKSIGSVFSTLLVTTFGFNSIARTVNLLTKLILAGLTVAFQLRLTEIINTHNFIPVNNF